MMSTSGEPYARNCPGCGTSFSALTERGICPQCHLFSRVDRHGELIFLVEEEYPFLIEPEYDDPQAEAPLATLFQLLEYNGGPIVKIERYGGKPPVDVAQRELLQRFQIIREQLDKLVPDIECSTIDDPSVDPDWIGSVFSEAVSLHVLTWHTGDLRFDVICEWTSDGGAIHAHPPDSEYYRQREHWSGEW